MHNARVKLLSLVAVTLSLLATHALAVRPELGSDSATVIIAGREPITHAAIRKILPDGILFICDQGLVKARFDQLIPEWEATFGDDAKRAAAKSAANASDMAAIQKARSQAARPAGRLEGRVLRVEGDLILLDCMEPMYTEDRTGFDLKIVEGDAVVQDAALAQKVQVGDYLKLTGARIDDFQSRSGVQYPCYTLLRLLAKM